MRKVILLALAVLALSVSCKKEKLKDDKAILIGNWEWVYTNYKYNMCTQSSGQSTTLNPETEGNNYSMLFEYEGRVKQFENGILKQDGRIIFSKFDEFDDSWGNGWTFIIHINNEEENRLRGRVWGDSLYTPDFPFKADDPPCDEYRSFFVRKM